jgi:hypothetical protein
MKTIPGRTTQECERFHRKLHKSGELRVLSHPRDIEDDILRKIVKLLVCIEFKFKEVRNCIFLHLETIIFPAVFAKLCCSELCHVDEVFGEEQMSSIHTARSGFSRFDIIDVRQYRRALL